MTTDRNLLFGVLALQTDLIDSKQFTEACGAWAARKDSPIADILVERGWITPADKAEVEKLVERKLHRLGGDVRASLAVVSPCYKDIGQVVFLGPSWHEIVLAI